MVQSGCPESRPRFGRAVASGRPLIFQVVRPNEVLHAAIRPSEHVRGRSLRSIKARREGVSIWNRFQVAPAVGNRDFTLRSSSTITAVMVTDATSGARTKNIAILGGSYGGASTAHYLLKHVVPQLPDKDLYQVVLVSASTHAMDRPACPRALISDDMFPQEKLFVSIDEAFKQYGGGTFRFIQGTVTTLDHTKRVVSIELPTTETTELPFDALVIATGASTPSPLLGLNRDVAFLRQSWADFRTALPAAKAIVISGGGPAGIETAGELGEYLNGQAGWFTAKLDNPKVSITVVNSGPKILPVLRESIATKAERYLARVGAAVLNNTKVTSVEPADAGTGNVGSKATVTLDDGRTLQADLYIPATGTTPNSGFVHKDLLTANGRVDTNPTTLRVDRAGPRIYALGDVSSAARPAVHLTFNAVPVVGANIKRDLLLASGVEEATAGEDRLYKEDATETQLVPIGKSKGVGSAMGYQVPSWLVWLIKGRDYWLWTTGDLWSGKQWAKESK